MIILKSSHRLVILSANKCLAGFGRSLALSSRCLSTEAQTRLETSFTTNPSTYRCSINDPTRHDREHVSKFYTISENEFTKLDPLNDSLDEDYYLMSKAFNEKTLMIRQPAIDIINQVKEKYENTSENFDVKKFILYGDKKGVGKRSTILHLMHYFQKKKWLIFHLPNASRILRLPKEIVESETNENEFNTSFEAIAFLKRFVEQNEELLKELDIRTQKEHKWDSREISATGTPFHELYQLALSRPKFSTNIVSAIIDEITMHANEKKFKVFLAIDQLNGYYGPTRLFRNNKQPITVDEVSLVNSFKRAFDKDKAKNMIFVGAVGDKGCVIPSPNLKRKRIDTTIHFQFRRRIPCSLHYEGPLTPKDLLSQEACENLGEFESIKIDNYSKTELFNHMEFYKEKRWFGREEAYTDDAREEIIFLSGYNPEEFKRVCKTI